MANVVSMKQLLEAGVHFGHQTRRWNPKMLVYLHRAQRHLHHRSSENSKKLDEAYMFVRILLLKAAQSFL